jgi:hypothetical protein
MAPFGGGYGSGQGAGERDGRRRAAGFVSALWAEPADADVAWLAGAATGGDLDHARWELRYARRALGLLVAQRDALDDRTGSLVAGEVGQALTRDPAVAVDMVPLAERQFNDRLAAYRDALRQRSAEPVGARLGRVLLVFAGSVRAARGAGLQQAGEILARYLEETNALLRARFGEVDLPDDVRPSELGVRLQ